MEGLERSFVDADHWTEVDAWLWDPGFPVKLRPSRVLHTVLVRSDLILLVS